jgi:hypothetical protein
MAATAPAQRTAPARRSPAKKPARRSTAPRRRRQQTPLTGFVPVAVGRTAGAVGGIADSGLFVWLTRGRLWIGVLGSLLVGIVALNVMALSFSASSSDAGRRADQLELENSTLRAELATKLSRAEVQTEAQRLGLVMPAAGSIDYLKAGSNDAEQAAQRLRDGELSTDVYVEPVTPPIASTTETASVTEPAVTAPTETVATEPVAADPAATATETETAPAPTDAAATAPASTDPAAAAASTATSGGGVGAP